MRYWTVSSMHVPMEYDPFPSSVGGYLGNFENDRGIWLDYRLVHPRSTQVYQDRSRYALSNQTGKFLKEYYAKEHYRHFERMILRYRTMTGHLKVPEYYHTNPKEGFTLRSRISIYSKWNKEEPLKTLTKFCRSLQTLMWYPKPSIF